MVSYVGYKALGMGFDAHLTLVYFGKNETEENISLMKDMCQTYSWHEFKAYRRQFDLFGTNKDIPVVKVEVPYELRVIQEDFQRFSKSEFSWNPHISLKAPFVTEAIIIPRYIELDQLGVY